MLRDVAGPWLLVAGFAIAASPGVIAQVTSQEGASLQVFPKVIADGTWDTVIQLTNGTNHLVSARCYYVNGAPTDPAAPPGPLNPPLWTQVPFRILLTTQQPTHWVVSRGRADNPLDQSCRMPEVDCDEAGFDPGAVPAVSSDFTGELVCVQVDASGAPLSGNALRGEATLTELGSGEVVKYPAIGIEGLATNNGDLTLCLGGQRSDQCPHGAEYRGCPSQWIVSHPSDFDDRPVDGSARSTSLTIVPCAQDFEAQSPRPVTLLFSLTNELEQTFSASTTITCWADTRLSDINPIFQRDSLGGDLVQTRIRPAGGTPGGVMVVQQTVRESARPALMAATAAVPHQEAVLPGQDVIVLPEEASR